MYQNQVLGQNQNMQLGLSPIKQARMTGPVVEYQFVSIKPKKQLKELSMVLKSEPKKMFGIKYGKKFNLKDRCVVCGMHHIWEAGDYLRPPIPLDNVTKGRPLSGTYCPRHASMYMQMEMLQQQILADKHGLDFTAFRPRMPKILKSGPIKNLTKEDIVSLTSAGYLIKPPTLGDNRSATNEAIEIVGEINILTDRLNFLMIKEDVRVEKIKEEVAIQKTKEE